MADLKISQLNSIVTVVPATDVLPVVQGATTYKMTPNQILGSGGVATLASATITGAATVGTTLGVTGVSTLASAVVTGALTVDTTTLVVDSTNDMVGVGTATPSYKFHAVATSGAVGAFRASTAAIARLLVGNTVGDLEIKVNANSDGQITSDAGKYLGLGSNTSNDRVILDTSGNLLVGVTSANANGGVLQLKSGITFPATQVAASDANTLDDYEEGTFTPTVVGSTIAGVGVYVLQVGRYTKVGNLVTVNVYMDWTAHTGTGNMSFGGLPFNTNSDANTFTAFTIGYAQLVALTASNVLTAFATSNTSNIGLYQYPVGGGSATAVPVDTSATVIYTGSYRV